jgi:hypothetical protein
MRLHPQFLIEGHHLLDGAPLWAPSDPPVPLQRPKQARDLTLSETLAPHKPSTRGAGRPPRRATGTFGQHVLDNMDHQHAGQLPCGDEQFGQCDSLFNGAHKTLHRRVIVAYAVGEA